MHSTRRNEHAGILPPSFGRTGGLHPEGHPKDRSDALERDRDRGLGGEVTESWSLFRFPVVCITKTSLVSQVCVGSKEDPVGRRLAYFLYLFLYL